MIKKTNDFTDRKPVARKSLLEARRRALKEAKDYFELFRDRTIEKWEESNEDLYDFASDLFDWDSEVLDSIKPGCVWEGDGRGYEGSMNIINNDTGEYLAEVEEFDYDSDLMQALYDANSEEEWKALREKDIKAYLAKGIQESTSKRARKPLKERFFKSVYNQHGQAAERIMDCVNACIEHGLREDMAEIAFKIAGEKLFNLKYVEE